MNKREFDALLRTWSNKKTKLLDRQKIAASSEETRHAALMHIVRKRGPVITDLVTPLLDRSWLNSMGYLYKTVGKHFTFIHTSAHRIM